MVIETKRLKLHNFSPDDWQGLLEYFSNPEVVRYLSEDPFTADDAKRFIENIKEQGGFPNKVAVELKAENKLIGHLVFKMFCEKYQTREIGWVFHPAYRGKGYATEAAAALIEYGFKQLKLHRTIATCDTRNIRSSRLMERLGMRREAHFIKNTFLKGEWADEYFYAILDEEWTGFGAK